MHGALSNPTVIVVVDRIDLDAQITATFNAVGVPNMVGADSRKVLQDLLAADTRKTIMTTIHKFGEAEGHLNDRSNIIVMVDEAHRTQEGDLGHKMRSPQTFDGWQATNAGERAVKQELRKIVYVRYKIKDQDLFDRAFGYVRQYY